MITIFKEDKEFLWIIGAIVIGTALILTGAVYFALVLIGVK